MEHTTEIIDTTRYNCRDCGNLFNAREPDWCPASFADIPTAHRINTDQVYTDLDDAGALELLHVELDKVYSGSAYQGPTSLRRLLEILFETSEQWHLPETTVWGMLNMWRKEHSETVQQSQLAQLF